MDDPVRLMDELPKVGSGTVAPGVFSLRELREKLDSLEENASTNRLP
jgi:hypothetical protein